MKCFVRPIISGLDRKSFIKELILEGDPCLAKSEFARKKKGEIEGREGGTFQAEGMKHARDLCR